LTGFIIVPKIATKRPTPTN